MKIDRCIIEYTFFCSWQARGEITKCVCIRMSGCVWIMSWKRGEIKLWCFFIEKTILFMLNMYFAGICYDPFFHIFFNGCNKVWSFNNVKSFIRILCKKYLIESQYIMLCIGILLKVQTSRYVSHFIDTGSLALVLIFVVLKFGGNFYLPFH